jgi:hypothetical protein
LIKFLEQREPLPGQTKSLSSSADLKFFLRQRNSGTDCISDFFSRLNAMSDFDLRNLYVYSFAVKLFSIIFISDFFKKYHLSYQTDKLFFSTRAGTHQDMIFWTKNPLPPRPDRIIEKNLPFYFQAVAEITEIQFSKDEKSY